MNAERKKAEKEIISKAVGNLDGKKKEEDDDIDNIRKKLARAAKLSPSSAIRIGRGFLKETDPEKH